jgi:hypothetical protein
MAWHGMADDLTAGAYQVIPNALLDPTPRPDLLADAGATRGDLRDALLAELTRQA